MIYKTHNKNRIETKSNLKGKQKQGSVQCDSGDQHYPFCKQSLTMAFRGLAKEALIETSGNYDTSPSRKRKSLNFDLVSMRDND